MDDKRYDACVDLMKELRSSSDELLGADLPNGKRAEFQDNSYGVVKYDFGLGDEVGDASIEIETDGVGRAGDGIDTSMLSDLDGYVFRFRCRFGPVNAKKLIDFLRTLEAEPEEKTVVCSRCGGTGDPTTGAVAIVCEKCSGSGRVTP